MDDKTNSGYARAPKVEDLVSLCRSLNEAGAKYILIGGFAVALHGFVRATKDIDFLVDTSEKNVSKIKKALASLPDNAIAELENDEVEKYQVVRVADEIIVDLMARACGIDYESAMKMIEYVEIDGIEIPIATKELLIKMKDTFRPSDKIDLNFLKCRIEEEKKFEETK